MRWWLLLCDQRLNRLWRPLSLWLISFCVPDASGHVTLRQISQYHIDQVFRCLMSAVFRLLIGRQINHRLASLVLCLLFGAQSGRIFWHDRYLRLRLQSPRSDFFVSQQHHTINFRALLSGRWPRAVQRWLPQQSRYSVRRWALRTGCPQL